MLSQDRAWGDSPITMLPLLRELMANGLRVWILGNISNWLLVKVSSLMHCY